MGLNGEPDQARSQVLGKDPVPSVRELYSIIREESRLPLMMRSLNLQQIIGSFNTENSALVTTKSESAPYGGQKC